MQSSAVLLVLVDFQAVLSFEEGRHEEEPTASRHAFSSNVSRGWFSVRYPANSGTVKPACPRRGFQMRPDGASAELDAVVAQPGVSALDQPRECLAETLDGSAYLLGIDVGGGVLQPALDDVQLVQ